MRSFYRKKLNRLLGSSGDEEFVQLLWATDALQSENPEVARRYILPKTIPDGAITTDMTSKHFIQKWEIETLANELMTVPKQRTSKNGRTRTLRWDHYDVSRQCVNWLRKLENAEYGLHKKKEHIFVEMGRIASRQFVWQIGFFNVPQFYRNAFVYGQGECEAYFAHRHGISFNRFSQIGFMLYIALRNLPVVEDSGSWKKFCKTVDVTWDEVERVLAIIALPFYEAARLAKEKRGGVIHTADRPSILRQAPCLRFGNQGERIRSPLPELILERITSGVFYDVVKGSGPVRDDYGKRFEEYCFRYLADMLSGYKWEKEASYRKKPHSFMTPDVLCFSSDQLEMAFECKATRMSQQAMFGKDPLAAKGYEDMTKAVFQLWRFFSHCRRGFASYNIAESAVGVVLTLDNWLVMAQTLQERVLKLAHEMADSKDSEIIDVDRKPIVFVTISELERTITTATESTFKEALIIANSEKYTGWRLDGIHSDLFGGVEHEKREYPYKDDLKSLLPWWDDIKKHKRDMGRS